ncbi:hypothetical protein [Streptomyces sp. SID3343]|uniref:hypothetical protein n=1 Tax=Streptomyces sp. SID3343 TaxID=2690260 RepID=UPI0013716EAF|nr:hypothetical protein [Streptomyces sp. SID3343]MYW05564.1 hypothetical protein [Streptomyces sp. SID3343]
MLRHPRNRAAVAFTASLSALVAGLLTVSPAQAAGSASAPVLRWTEAVLPDEGVVVDSLIHPDAATTWSGGTRIIREGKATRFEPVLYTADAQGRAWHRVPLAQGTTTRSRLNDVDATSATSAVLVGDYDRGLGGVLTQRLAAGSWQVSVAPVPANTLGGGLLQVDALTPDDAWAVGWVQILDRVVTDPETGESEQISHSEPLVRHWDGTAWRASTLPRVASSWSLADVRTTATDDVWAVGRTDDDSQPVIMHFDGLVWTRVATPSYGGTQGELLSLTERGGKLVAVGSRKRVTDGAREGAALGYDGSAWRQVNLPSGTGPLVAVTASPHGVAAVGTDDDGTSYGVAHNGRRFRSLALPNSPSLSLTSILADTNSLMVGGVRPATQTSPARPVVLIARR